MYLVLLFAAVALLGDCRSATVNKHMKIISDMDNRIQKMPHKYKRFVSITKPPSATYTHEPGTTLSLKCTVLGSPAPSVLWFKNDVPVFEFDQESTELINSSPRSLAEVTSELLVTRAAAHDVYTCLGTAGPRTARATTTVYGKGTNTDVSERTRLYPLAPQIVVTYKLYIDVMGSDAVLPCKAKGHPRPVITWTDNRNNTITKNSRMKILRSGELMISSLRWSDMGGFTCHATNAFGTQDATTFLYPAEASKAG